MQTLSKPEPKDIRIVNKDGVGFQTKVFVDGEEMDISRVSRITIEIPADGAVEVTYHYLVIEDDSFTFTQHGNITQHGSIEDEPERPHSTHSFETEITTAEKFFRYHPVQTQVQALVEAWEGGDYFLREVLDTEAGTFTISIHPMEELGKVSTENASYRAEWFAGGGSPVSIEDRVKAVEDEDERS